MDFDLTSLQKSLRSLGEQEAEIKAAQNRVFEDNQRKHKAVIQTAENTFALKVEVSSIRSGLTQESAERRKVDRRNFVLAIIATVFGVIGTIVGILAFLFPRGA